ncbi:MULTISPECIES: hypothetical protein [unclassified Helicobacter]|nr:MULTISPECIES: hypothetical protein [unclassified Helicobacter]
MPLWFLNGQQQKVFDCCLLFGLLGYGAYLLIKEVIEVIED